MSHLLNLHQISKVQCVARRMSQSKSLSDSRHGTTAAFLIPEKRFCQYSVCKLLVSHSLLCRKSVKYVSLEGVPDDKYFIFDQQQNVIRLSHHDYFCKTILRNKGDCKVLSTKDFKVAVIHFMSRSSVPLIEAESQGLFTFFNEVRGIMKVVSELTTLKDKVSNFLQDNSSDCIALVLDVLSIFTSLFESTSNLSLLSIVDFLLRIISIVLRVSTLKEKFATTKPQLQFDINLDSISWFLAGFGLPSFIVKRIKLFNDLTGKRVFDSDGVISSLFDAIDLFLEVLRWLSENFDCFGVLTFLYGFLSTRFSFISNYKIMKLVNNLHFRWAKNSQVMLEPSFREEVMRAHKLALESTNFREFVNDDKRRMNRVVYESFVGNIVRYCRSFDTATRLEPGCIIFEGQPGCGKSVLMGNLSKVLSSSKVNMSVYSHIIPSLDSAKDFYDDYEGQDVMVVDDIGQQGISQWRTIINMVSSIKMGLDCAAADKKNTKFFTSKLILGTSNSCHNLHGLSKNDGISDIGALYRRIHNVRMSKGVSATTGKPTWIAEYYKYDEAAKQWVNTFLPKWHSTAGKFGLLPNQLGGTVRFESEDPNDLVEWSLRVIKMVLAVNEDTLDATSLDEGFVDKMGGIFASLQAGHATFNYASDSVKLDIQKEQTWKAICSEYFCTLRNFLLRPLVLFRISFVALFLIVTGKQIGRAHV